MTFLCVELGLRSSPEQAIAVDGGWPPDHPRAMTQAAHFPEGWVFDQRGTGRAVRVSAHVEAGFLILSTWKSDACVATVRLLPAEAARLVSNIADGLSRLATPPENEADDDLGRRLAQVEARPAELEVANRE